MGLFLPTNFVCQSFVISLRAVKETIAIVKSTDSETRLCISELVLNQKC